MRFAGVALLCLLAAPVGAANILPNPSFESWAGNIPTGWLTSEILYPGSAIPDSGARSGDLCLELVGGDTSAFASSATVVREGFSYEFAAWARCPAVLGGSFVLQFATLGLNLIGAPALIPVVYSGSSWREHGQWLTAPDSAFFLVVAFATLPGATVFLDDVTVDDTALLHVEEPPVPSAARSRPGARKILASADRIRALGPGVEVYDGSGRRIVDRSRLPRVGLYFVVED